MWFLLFLSPKPRSQVWILVYRKLTIGGLWSLPHMTGSFLLSLTKKTRNYFSTSQSIFQLSVESILGLNWCCFTSLCDWPTKLTPLSRPIRCKTEQSRLGHVCFSVLCAVWLVSHWVLIGSERSFDYSGLGFMTLNWKALQFRNIVGKTELISGH